MHVRSRSMKMEIEKENWNYQMVPGNENASRPARFSIKTRHAQFNYQEIIWGWTGAQGASNLFLVLPLSVLPVLNAE